MSEAKVVCSLKEHLVHEGLEGTPVTSVLVDSDGSYCQSRYRSRLEPFARIEIDGFRPDLICQYGDASSPRVAAFEVKPAGGDWGRGLFQAHTYRTSAHASFLAIPVTSELERKRIALRAEQFDLGFCALTESMWNIALPPSPTPCPLGANRVLSALQGVPSARKLQLNHPLNYLVPALLRHATPTGDLDLLMSEQYPDLKAPGSRQHAIVGAQTLGLLGRNQELTLDGLLVATSMISAGYTPGERISKAKRFAETSPTLSLVARGVMLRQQVVLLVVRALQQSTGQCVIPQLFDDACKLNAPLAQALFLRCIPDAIKGEPAPSQYSNSAVYQFKQSLWHAGVLATKAHASAGKAASSYRPKDDVWSLAPDLRAVRLPPA